MTPIEFDLIGTTTVFDSLRQSVPTKVRRHRMGLLGSVSGAEFSSAGLLGLRPSGVIVLFAPDYDGETEVEMGGMGYTVYRTYSPSPDRVELYLERRLADERSN